MDIITDKNESKSKKILIVDDEPINIELLEDLLIPQKYIVEGALNGEEALAKIQKDLPDLILLDVMMPGMNGFQVCSEVRKNSSLPYIPIIFITAYQIDQSDIIHGLDMGGDDYIRKPFDSSELFSRIRSCLRVKKLYDDLARTKTELSRYVSLSTVDMVEKKASKEVFQADRAAVVTVLFSDIRGFTNFSENMVPAEIFKMLNLNLSRQIKVIEKYNGIIDKLNGDEIMAIFEGPDMASNALKCARGIVKALSVPQNSKLLDWAGVGIGINTGQIYLGSLGSDTFKDYTIVGNTVNIAARLCGFASQYQILFTEATLKLIKKTEFNYRPVKRVSLKGISSPINVLELIQHQD
jgi:DNA-binding response OmpR family regulator